MNDHEAPPKYLIEFIDSSQSDSEMFDGYNILQVDGKEALSIATCWDPAIAGKILAGLEMCEMMDSGVIPGSIPPQVVKPKTRSRAKVK